MSDRNAGAEVLLETLVSDVRHTEGPELDWSAIEARLMERVQHAGVRRVREQRRRGVSAWLLAGAVAATAVFSVLSFRGDPPPGTATASPPSGSELATPPLDDGLSVGERIAAGAEPVLIEHAGLAKWQLLPGGSAEVRALDPSVVIQLQSGRLRAEVVQSARPESFVVEVGGLRAAVRGTVFSVTREGEHAVVDVSEGTVAVGPVDKPASSLLVGPAAGRFLATGERAGAPEQTRGTVNRPPAPARQTSARPLEPAPEAAVALPDEPTFEDVEKGLFEVEAALGHCLVQHTAGTGKVRLSLTTRVTLKVQADGSLSRYRFVPPLSPDVATCVRGPLEQLRFAPSGVGTHIIRDLEIAR